VGYYNKAKLRSIIIAIAVTSWSCAWQYKRLCLLNSDHLLANLDKLFTKLIIATLKVKTYKNTSVGCEADVKEKTKHKL
jgi:hypothetical protein